MYWDMKRTLLFKTKIKILQSDLTCEALCRERKVRSEGKRSDLQENRFILKKISEI
jgi:hypothetical protein